MTAASRDRICAEARRWVGTPYLHQASAIGHGCDCLGLVRGIWRAAIGPEPEMPPPYSRDWGEHDGAEPLLQAACRWLEEIDPAAVEPGDVIAFRWSRAACVKHLGVLVGPDRFIHAWERAGVVETRLAAPWRSRIAAAFRFPEV